LKVALVSKREVWMCSMSIESFLGTGWLVARAILGDFDLTPLRN